MGTYDTIKIEVPLPDGFDPQRLEWQTKDISDFMCEHVIEADGVLYLTRREWYDDEGPVHEPETEIQGDVLFYGDNVTARCGKIVVTSGDEPIVAREYMATFTNGKLQNIRLVDNKCGLADKKRVTYDEFKRLSKGKFAVVHPKQAFGQ